VVVPQDGLQTGYVARELSSSGMDEHQCSAQVRRADPCVRRDAALHEMLVAHHGDPAVGVVCRA
jgi:hypothetical protein